jgi:hypothetical protein
MSGTNEVDDCIRGEKGKGSTPPTIEAREMDREVVRERVRELHGMRRGARRGGGTLRGKKKKRKEREPVSETHHHC